MYAKVINGVIIKCPYSLDELYTDNPGVYFPSNLTDDILKKHNAVRVVITDIANYNRSTHTAEPDGCIYNTEKSRWETNWKIRSLTVEEIQQKRKVTKDLIHNQTQARLDLFAQTRGYNDVNSLGKFQNITDLEIASMPIQEQASVKKFRTECRYLAVMTARTWAVVIKIFDEIDAGQRSLFTQYADIERDLPVLQWPN